MSVNILLADDHKMIREGLKQLLEMYDDIKVVGEAGDGFECLNLADKTHPDVILLDINMPNLDGLQVLNIIKTQKMDCKVIVLTIHNEIEYLIKAIDFSFQNEVSFLILQFFDDYVGEVRKHMEYENEKVFTYVRGLLNGERSAQYNIGVFARHHDQVNAKLTELKNIIIKYYPANGDNQLLNATLFDIFSCEEDLASHNRVEDYLFVPAIMELEKGEK